MAAARLMPGERLYETYLDLLSTTLRRKATPTKNVNVLQHIMGYFKKDLSVDEKKELLEVIGAYREELVPLVVAVTLLNHRVRKYQQVYLAEQVYLHPHPEELHLRNQC